MAAVNRKRASQPETETSRVTDQTIWQLRAQIAGALSRIEELEAQMLIMAHGGKEKEFYTVEETAQIWGMSKGTLYVMIREGRLPAVKIGDHLRIARATLLKGTN